jgi:hypothetical protein
MEDSILHKKIHKYDDCKDFHQRHKIPSLFCFSKVEGTDDRKGLSSALQNTFALLPYALCSVPFAI